MARHLSKKVVGRANSRRGFRSVSFSFDDGKSDDSCSKQFSVGSTCSSTDVPDEDLDDLEQAMNPEAPEFVPQIVLGSVKEKHLSLRPAGEKLRSLSIHADEFVPNARAESAACVLKATAEEFVPRCSPSQPETQKGESGLSADDVAFLLNIRLSGGVPKAAQPKPNSSLSAGASLNAGASEFHPQSMQTKALKSKPESAISSGARNPQGLRSLNACAAEFVPQTLIAQRPSVKSELSLDASAAEFVPQSSSAAGKSVLVCSLANQFVSPSGDALTSSCL